MLSFTPTLMQNIARHRRQNTNYMYMYTVLQEAAYVVLFEDAALAAVVDARDELQRHRALRRLHVVNLRDVVAKHRAPQSHPLLGLQVRRLLDDAHHVSHLFDRHHLCATSSGHEHGSFLVLHNMSLLSSSCINS